MNEHIQSQGVQTITNRLFNRTNQTEQGRIQVTQLGYQRQGAEGTNRSFKIAARHTLYDLWRALRVLASAAETGEAMIVSDENALWIITYDWIKTKAATLKLPKLIKRNPNAIGRYYVVDVWELYEAVNKLFGYVVDPWRLYMLYRLRPSKDDVTIGIEDNMSGEATVYVELDAGIREQLKARVVDSHKAEPSLEPVVGIWIYVKPFFGALTRARRAGAKYVNITLMPYVMRIKGGKYVTEIRGDMIIPGVIEGRMMPVLEGCYPIDAIYDVVSHSTEFSMLQVSITVDRLLYFDYVIEELIAYITPAI